MNLNKNAKIVRVWHGVVPAGHSGEYYQYLLETGLKDYASTEGNCGVFVLRRTDVEEEQTHFLLITLWNSYESIKEFAGKEFERARYYPEDKKYLTELEPFVKHYEVLN